MLLEQIYIFLLYILLLEFAMITIVAFSLFVALLVTIRKLNNKKNTSLPGR